jgi:hypothetical protein
MTLKRSALLLALVVVAPLAGASEGRQADVDALNQLIDRYGAYQAAMDAAGMSKLMATDRVCLSQHFGGRRTDNVLNMKIQQLQLDVLKKEVPGMQELVEDRERLIKLHGDGSVATASFFRYITRVFPAGTAPELMQKYAADPPLAISLVLEKRGGQWIIVHTHASDMSVSGGGH